jgi:hypothetical protein
MMGTQKSEAQLFSYAVSLEKRVRANHPLRQVKAATAPANADEPSMDCRSAKNWECQLCFKFTLLCRL